MPSELTLSFERLPTLRARVRRRISARGEVDAGCQLDSRSNEVHSTARSSSYSFARVVASPVPSDALLANLATGALLRVVTTRPLVADLLTTPHKPRGLLERLRLMR
eukprot:698949-Pleurochrysis_carterae.AAC.1